MINNFDKLQNICKFEQGTYYKFVALIRKKDYKEEEKCILQNEKGEMFVRQWFIESKEDLEKYKQDMIDLCNACKCRLYMTLDKKSIKKTVIKMKEQLDDMIKNYCFNPENKVSLRKLSKFSASASQMSDCSASDKYFLLDYDYGNEKANNLVEDIKVLFPDSYVETLPTLNGQHIILKRNFDPKKKFDFIHSSEYWYEENENIRRWNVAKWNIQAFRNDLTLKENALTLVYVGF